MIAGSRGRALHPSFKEKIHVCTEIISVEKEDSMITSTRLVGGVITFSMLPKFHEDVALRILLFRLRNVWHLNVSHGRGKIATESFIVALKLFKCTVALLQFMEIVASGECRNCFRETHLDALRSVPLEFSR